MSPHVRTAATLLRARYRTLGLAGLTTRVRQRPGSRRRARVGAVAVIVGALLLVPAAVAAAADANPTNPWLSPFAIKDSHGFTVDQYSLSLGGEDGFSRQAIIDAVGNIIAILGWDAYRLFAGIGLWLIDWALRFQILEIFSTGASLFAAALTTTIGRIGLTSTLMALAAVYFVVSVNKGQMARGVAAFLMSFAMAALVNSPQVNLIDQVAGEDGALAHSRDIGMSMAVDITTAGQTTGVKDADTLRQVTVAKIADVVMRTPHQLINYGAVIDAKCAKTYDDAVKAGAMTEDARSKIGDCNETYKAAANSPMQAAGGIIFVAPGGGIIVLLGVILAAGLAVMCVFAMIEAASLSWQLLKAIIPGDSRGHVFQSLGVIGMCLLAIIATIFGLGLLVVTIDAVFRSEKSSPVLGFVILDLTLAIGAGFMVSLFIKARKRGQSLGRSVADTLSPGTAGGQGTHPMRQFAQMASGAAATSWAARRHLGVAPPAGTPRQPGDVDGDGVDPGTAPLTPAQKLQHGVGRGAHLVGRTAVLAVQGTVGAPVYAPRAVGHIKQAADARKAATMAKLAAARTKAGEKAQAANDFAAEYRHNVQTAAGWVRRPAAAAKERAASRGGAYHPEAGDGPMRASHPRTDTTPSRGPSRPVPRPAATRQAPARQAPARTEPTPAPSRPRRGPVTVDSLTRDAGLAPSAAPPASAADANRAQSLRDRLARSERRTR